MKHEFGTGAANAAEKGVTAGSIAEIAFRLQGPYNKTLTTDVCLESVKGVPAKREVLHALITGIALDERMERKLLPEPMQSILKADGPLYEVDETPALGIVHVYGMIGLTSFGYRDKQKIGIIRNLIYH